MIVVDASVAVKWLFRTEVRAGRDESKCVVLLEDPSVSGVHATLKIEGGQFWGPRYAAKGEPRLSTPTRTSRDPRIGARVWAFAEQAVGVRFDAEAVGS